MGKKDEKMAGFGRARFGFMPTLNNYLFIKVQSVKNPVGKLKVSFKL